MENPAVLTLAALCVGIALSGLLAVVVRRGDLRERVSLGLVYVAFIGMIALPLIKAFAEGALTNFMPLLLIFLLVLPPAFFHAIAAKTATAPLAQLPWRDLAMPLAGCVVCIGFWILPAHVKEAMFISGDLPPGFLPAALALSAFVLMLLWIHLVSPLLLLLLLFLNSLFLLLFR